MHVILLPNIIVGAIVVHARRGLRRLRPTVILLAILIHLTWGAALILNPIAESAAAILGGFHWMLSYGVEARWLGSVLLAGALLALAGLLLDTRLPNGAALALLMPQFGLLIASFLSDSQSVASGVLPDGRVVDQLVLFTALCPVMFMALLHTLAIIERHSTWTRT